MSITDEGKLSKKRESLLCLTPLSTIFQLHREKFEDTMEALNQRTRQHNDQKKGQYVNSVTCLMH